MTCDWPRLPALFALLLHAAAAPLTCSASSSSEPGACYAHAAAAARRSRGNRRLTLPSSHWPPHTGRLTLPSSHCPPHTALLTLPASRRSFGLSASTWRRPPHSGALRCGGCRWAAAAAAGVVVVVVGVVWCAVIDCTLRRCGEQAARAARRKIRNLCARAGRTRVRLQNQNLL